MNVKFTKLMAALALLVFLTPPAWVMGQEKGTKKEGFETKTTSISYNGTVVINENESDCGIGWTIYYGTVSTNSIISGNNSAQMRWYSNASYNYPYIKSTTAVEDLTIVSFKAKVGNTAVKMDVCYSTDGENWTILNTETFTDTEVKSFEYEIPSGGKYLKIGVSSSSTAPSNGNYALIVDDVVFTDAAPVSSYIVNFNLEGGTFVSNEDFDESIVEIEAGSYHLPSATREGFTFAGWNDGNQIYAANAMYTINEDVDFIAQWISGKTATYTIQTTTSVSSTGAPVGSNATFSNTYTTATQLTKDKSMTLTLSGYEGQIIKGITLSMHSNKNDGKGSMSAKVGETTIASISDATFASNSWNGSYTTSWVNITPTITSDYIIQSGENVVITIAATINSLFCQSFTILYEASTTPAVKPSTYTITAMAAETDGTLNVTYSNISEVQADVYLCNAEGEGADYDWFGADIDGNNNVHYLINANTGVPRTAYFKVWAYNDEVEEVYSDIVTVTQAGASYDLTLDYNSGYVSVNVGDENWNEFEFSGNVAPVIAGTLVRISVAEEQYCEVQSVTVSGISELPFDEEDHSYYFNMPAAATTITVVAGPRMVTYKYSINGVEGNATTVQQGTQIALETEDNFNDEFTFAGWTKDPSNVGQPLNGTYTLMENETTFYAVYAKTETGVATEQVVILDGNQFGTSQPTTETELEVNGFTYKYIGGKKQAVQNGAVNSFTNGYTILIGKTGKYLYNTTPFGDGITKFEVYANKGASTKVSVGVNFSTTSISSYDANAANIWTMTLDQEDHVYDASESLPTTGGAKYFWYQVTNDKSSQVQFRITYISRESTTTYYTRVFTKEITASQWNFIASPVGSAPTNIDDLSDLYFYDEQDHFWRNKKVTDNASGFDFAIGKGYLGGNQNSAATLTFAGTTSITGETHSIGLEYHATTTANEENSLAGWNLVGNPFACAATLNMDCYTISGTAINTTAQAAGSYTVAPCEGVMVKATEPGQTVTFTKSTVDALQPNQLQMTVAQQVVNRDGVSTGSTTLHDNAIINFNAGSRLEKFTFNEDAAKLYIPQGGKDFAIVSAEAQGEMPLNFKAASDGQYTLTVNPEGVEMNYLHLIDNMTGANIDLLQTPSYSFDATTRDYESRFRLVFAANSEEGVSTGSTAFAFVSNGNLIVSNDGEATLQVIDVTGRILGSYRISGTAEVSLNQASGVYVLRLVNGNDVKTQKVVVR